jgi:plastocyanin
MNKKAVIGALVALAALAVYGYFVAQKQGNVDKQDTIVTPGPLEPRRAFVEKVESEAVLTTTIDVTSCKGSPSPAHFKIGDTIEFKNSDTAAHTISFSPSRTYVIPAKGKLSVKFNFWDKPGVRKYSCDGTPEAGLVFITRT